MGSSKKERERLREAMSKSLAVSPKRQQEIAEMLKSRLGTEERKPEEKVEEVTLAPKGVVSIHFRKMSSGRKARRSETFTEKRRFPRAKVAIPVK